MAIWGMDIYTSCLSTNWLPPSSKLSFAVHSFYHHTWPTSIVLTRIHIPTCICITFACACSPTAIHLRTRDHPILPSSLFTVRWPLMQYCNVPKHALVKPVPQQEGHIAVCVLKQEPASPPQCSWNFCPGTCTLTCTLPLPLFS